MQIVPFVCDAFLNVKVEVQCFEKSAWSADHSGSTIFQLLMTNASSFAAQFPFFCVTDLGLNVSAAPEWGVERIASNGRRQLRFAPEKRFLLLQGDGMVACMLTVNWRMEHGVVVSTDAGNGCSPEGPRDLRFSCMTGAANFPPERTYVTVPAALVQSTAERAAFARPDFVDRRRLAAV